MNKNGRPPTRNPKNIRHLGYLSEAQDSTLDALAEKISRKRGTDVTRSDVTREALSLYSREHGEEWPG